MSRALIKDTTIYGVGQVLTRAFGFLLIPLYTRYLDVAEYGSLALLNLILQVVSFICLMGISQAAMRFYYDPGADEAHRHGVYGTATTLLLALPVAAVLAAGPVIWLLAREFMPSIPFYPYILLVLVAGLFTPLDKLMSGLLRIQRRATAFVVFNLGFFLFQTLTIIIAVAVLGYGLVGQLWAQVIANGAFSVAAYLVLRGYSKPVLDRPMAVRLLRFGLPLVPFFILTWVSTASGRFMLEGFGTLTDVGLFALAAQFAGLLLIVSTAADSALLPHFLERAGRSGTEDELGLLITRYLAIVGLVSLAVVAFSGPVIGLMSAPAYHAASLYVAPLVLANWLFTSARPIVIWCLNHTSRTGTLSILQGGNVALLVMLLYLCLGPLDLGIHGVAVAGIIANLAFIGAGYWVTGFGFRPRIPWLRLLPITAVLLAAGGVLAYLGQGTALEPAPLGLSLLVLVAATLLCFRLAGIRNVAALFRRGG